MFFILGTYFPLDVYHQFVLYYLLVPFIAVLYNNVIQGTEDGIPGKFLFFFCNK